MKGIGQLVRGDVPGLCQGGDDVQVFVRLDQGIEELVCGPDDGLVLGKGGVEGGDARKFVVVEDGSLVVRSVGAAGSQQNDDGQGGEKGGKCEMFIY